MRSSKAGKVIALILLIGWFFVRQQYPSEQLLDVPSENVAMVSDALTTSPIFAMPPIPFQNDF